jgi:predicted hydrolase (HD superfamily)
MNRADALAILHEMTETASLRRHARSVEIVMRALARRHGENEDEWGAAGMLHDADYEKWPQEHPGRIVARLRALGQETVAHAISAHYTKWNVPYDTLLSKALVATDELTGFVVACCLVRPDGITSLEPKSVHKKFKDRSFAAKVEREEIQRGCQVYGVELLAQVAAILEALRPFAQELGLLGSAHRAPAAEA